jgi:hypothetical protein
MQPATHKSLTAKLRQAIDAFDSGRVAFACETHVEHDIDELDLPDTEAYQDLIYECLQIAQTDPLACFRQPDPAKSTKHSLTRNLPMWAFEVQHPRFREKIYLKFCLKEQRDGTFYCHIDCHGSRPKN